MRHRHRRHVGALGGDEASHDNNHVSRGSSRDGLIHVRQVAFHNEARHRCASAQLSHNILEAGLRVDGVQRVDLGGAAAALAGELGELGLADDEDLPGIGRQRQEPLGVLEHRHVRADATHDRPVALGVDLARCVGAIKLVEAEHLRVTADKRGQ